MVEGGALQGLRVLDMTDASGRLAGKLLAEAGADVVRLRREAAGPLWQELQPNWSVGYQVKGGASGHIMVTPTPNAPALVRWLAEERHDEAADSLSHIGRIPEQITKNCSSSGQPGFTR